MPGWIKQWTNRDQLRVTDDRSALAFRKVGHSANAVPGKKDFHLSDHDRSVSVSSQCISVVYISTGWFVFSFSALFSGVVVESCVLSVTVGLDV